jgi:hypothetical protein
VIGTFRRTSPRHLLAASAFCCICVGAPTAVVAEQEPTAEPRREVPSQGAPTVQEHSAYDPTAEATFTGTVTDIPGGGPGRLGWLMRVHTFGLGHSGPNERQLLLTTDTDTLRVHLGPTAFLRDRNIEIKKGDRVDVTGSKVTFGDSQILLAREIRKGDDVWELRDCTGQPLWNTSEPEKRRFWTKTKVLLVVVGVKVALLATVLRH